MLQVLIGVAYRVFPGETLGISPLQFYLYSVFTLFGVGIGAMSYVASTLSGNTPLLMS